MRKIAVIIVGLANLQCWALPPDSISISEVEITAASPRNSITSTVPRQEIDHGQMVQLGIFDIEQALRHMSGITVKDYGGAGGLKTVSTRGIGAKHTAVVYDGVALTDCQAGAIDLSRYSMDNMQSVALTIGDGDDIFMPARNVAAAATLELHMDLGEYVNKGQNLRVGTTLGSWDTIKPTLFYRRRIANNLTMNVQGEYLHSINDYPFTLYNLSFATKERRTNSRVDNGHGEANLSWRIDNANTLGTKVYYYDSQRQLPGIVHLYTQDNDEQLRERNTFVQLHYTGLWSERWAMKSAAKFNWNGTEYSMGIPSGGIKDERYWQREYYLSNAILFTPTDYWSWDYSVDYSLNNLNSTLHTPTAAVNAPISVNPFRHSLLQTLVTKISTARMTATARVLMSNYWNGVGVGEAAHDAHRWSPSVSLSYRLSKQPQLYARVFWKNIFRVPTFNELYYYHIGSAELRPENTNQYNIGLTGNLQGRGTTLRFTIDAYVADVRDKIIAIPFNMFVWHMMNIFKVRTYGVDLTMDATVILTRTQVLGLSTNYSFQDAMNRTNPMSPFYSHQIAYTPQHTFAGTLTWTNPWVNLSATVDGMGERWTTNEHAPGTCIDGYTELGVSAYRTFKCNKCHVTVRGGVQNVLNKQYEIVANYPMPGRSWKLSALFEI
ncbi:MAG: TonB-dependent receptor plug domain-containing protein [Prevotella sp.]|nr:TonB-dependent receptor plug domain-containing protein [Prevotella sp.]